MARAAGNAQNIPAILRYENVKNSIRRIKVVFVIFSSNLIRMVASPVYHRTRPYSDRELYAALMSYLDNRFLFRRLEIDQWLDDDRIIFKRKGEHITSVLNSGMTAEELWETGNLEDWATYSPMTAKNICSEFMFQNSLTVARGRKTLIRSMIKAEIEQGEITKTIRFEPKLKALIEAGRQRVTGIKPLPYGSQNRIKIELNQGDSCFICYRNQAPYMANPAYVYKKLSGSYLVIFFSNRLKGTETSKTDINAARFINASADELGLTPEQAVLQRFY